ncbi:MAG: adenine phosphoribosyltransferase [Clostridiaceae bacterium]|nr:adenine phosphoribosyltransferase [Clostridiaceae bacterium]
MKELPKYYPIDIHGLKRQLHIVKVSDDLAIAALIILGDVEAVSHCAKLLAERIPEVDVLITAEAKGIPLVHELSRVLNIPRYVVARKSKKTYMEDPLTVDVESITTIGHQKLYLPREDLHLIQGKRVGIIDDVISTGQSLKSLEELIEQAGGKITVKAAILAEGDAIGRKDIIYLQELPLFPIEK